MYCDLHTHSTASDGTDMPGDLPRLAKQAGLGAIALTDHDTTAGLAEFVDAAKRAKVKAVPGIELSADPSVLHAEPDKVARLGTLHILGYFINPESSHLAEIEVRLREARAQRNPEMVAKLNELGMNIDYEEVIEAAGGPRGTGTSGSSGTDENKIVGRPHIGQVMMQKGYVKSIHEAFARYIGQGGAAYVRKDRLSAEEAISAIHEAEGLAVLAHPTQLGIDSADHLEHAVARLKSLGIDGIETRHSDHEPRDTEQFNKLAEQLNLLTTGGSDYHGSRKTVVLGGQKVPLSIYENLLNAHSQRAGA
jgi:3',5'-nucleoside bisphosphate phosphatase